MRTVGAVSGLVAVTLWAACGGSSSAPDAAAPPPEAPPAATPTPVPITPPTPAVPSCEDPCEPPVDNNNPAVRVSIRLYILTDDKGRQVRDWDPEMLPVGWHLTLDAVAKDAEGRETNGDKVLRWFIDNEAIVKVGGNHSHQTKITPTAPGQIEVYAKQDGVTSNQLRFVFIP